MTYRKDNKVVDVSSTSDRNFNQLRRQTHQRHQQHATGHAHTSGVVSLCFI